MFSASGNKSLPMAAQHRHTADNGCAVDGIQPTACMEIYFPGFRAPDPPLPLMPNVGPPSTINNKRKIKDIS